MCMWGAVYFSSFCEMTYYWSSSEDVTGVAHACEGVTIDMAKVKQEI